MGFQVSCSWTGEGVPVTADEGGVRSAQSDGLVEHFNQTLTSMLAKRVDCSGSDWDSHLPYILFAYRASIQESTMDFYSMAGT